MVFKFGCTTGPVTAGVAVLLVAAVVLVHGAAVEFAAGTAPTAPCCVPVAATFALPWVTVGCAAGRGCSAAQRGDEPPTLPGAALALFREA